MQEEQNDQAEHAVQADSTEVQILYKTDLRPREKAILVPTLVTGEIYSEYLAIHGATGSAVRATRTR